MQEQGPSSLLSLDRDTLHRVLKLSEPEALAGLSCTCRELREAASEPVLWESFCRRRWRHLNINALAGRHPKRQQEHQKEVPVTSPGAAAGQERPASVGAEVHSGRAHPHAHVDQGGERREGGAQESQSQEIEGLGVRGAALDAQQPRAQGIEGEGDEGQEKQGVEGETLDDQGGQGDTLNEQGDGYGAEGKPGVVQPDDTLEAELELLSSKTIQKVTPDGGVVKKTLTKGTKYATPRTDFQVRIRYTASLPDGTVFEERGEGNELEYLADDDQVIPGLDLAVMRMQEGEVAEVTIAPEYAFGENSDPAAPFYNPEVPPNATVIYRVDLVSFVKAKDSWELNEAEKVAEATSRKEHGNLKFKQGRWEGAVKRYKNGVRLIQHDKCFSNENKAAALVIKRSANLNLAAAHLKLGQFKDAIAACNKVLEREARNSKALYRRAQAYLAQCDYHEAEQDIKKALEAEPASRDFRALHTQWKRAFAEHTKKEKRVFGNIFDKMAKADAKGEKAKEQREQAREGQCRSGGQAVHGKGGGGGGGEGYGPKAQGGNPPGVGMVAGEASRELYVHNNAWDLGFEVRKVPLLRDFPSDTTGASRVVSFAVTTPAEAGWSLAEAGPDDEILLTGQVGPGGYLGCGLNYGAIYGMGGEGKGRTPMRRSWGIPRRWDVCIYSESVLPFSSNRVAFGADFSVEESGLLIYRIPYEDEPPILLGRVKQESIGNQPAMDLLYCPANEAMYAHYAARAYMGDTFICAYDLTAMRMTARVRESMESHQLSCMCPGSDQDAWGNELYAAAVHKGACDPCYPRPSLCFHKSQADTAAICVFDLRASLSMVSRYSTHHRGVYPRMCSARSHYLFTSHAGNPLCVWDKRQMSVPLYEEQQLGSFSPADPPGKYPLGNPSGSTRTQAMYLDTDGDVLVGRADNGMLWLWDLSKTLGWADGSRSKSWHALAQHAHDEMPSTFRDLPVALGAWRIPRPLTEAVRIHGGRRSCLLAFGVDPDCDSPSDYNPPVLLSASIVPAAPI